MARWNPADLSDVWWDVVVQFFDLPIKSVCEHHELCQSLLQLSAASDEACFVVGTDSPYATIETEPGDQLWTRAESLLAGRRGDASLCLIIDPARVRVLPKSRTPRLGMTLRSTSLYLALVPGGEVNVGWYNVCGWKPEIENYLNLLLVPWPTKIVPADFRELTLNADSPYSPDYAMFSFAPARGEEDGEEAASIKKLMEAAKKLVRKIDGVVFPEAAIDSIQLERIWEAVASENCLLIAGVRGDGQNGFQTNCIETRVPVGNEKQGFIVAYKQAKHHRWQLERSQLVTYGLASQLHLDQVWWEGIEIGRRELNFVAIQPWLTTCALICEDLARQDPIAEIIRAVGPSLVVALLMDGPQLKTRWPSRYATVLADDPGTSVLTLSSIGMVELSRPMEPGLTPSRVIALWKDPQSPSAIEIPLPPGAGAIVLSLVNTNNGEQAADGRLDGEPGTTLVLGGVHPVFI